MHKMTLYSNFYIDQPPKRRLSFIFYPVDSSSSPHPHADSHLNLHTHSHLNTQMHGNLLSSRSHKLAQVHHHNHNGILASPGNLNTNSVLVRQGHGHDDNDNGNGDLCTSLRIFLRFGRLLGILPLDGLFSRQTCTENLKYNRCSLASLTNKFIIIILSFNVCIGILNMFYSQKETASELAFSCAMAFFYFMGTFTYVYFGKHCHEFIELLKIWKRMKRLYFSSHATSATAATHSSSDERLFHDTNLVAGLIFTSAILENMLLFCLQSEIILFPFQKRMTSPLMDIYYHKSHVEWTRVVYNQTNTNPAMYLGYFVFFSNKFALYAWNYADTAIIILSRALYYKFFILNKVAENQLLQLQQRLEGGDGDIPISVTYNIVPQWKQLTIDHAILCQLLSDFEDFLSPLIFTCFATNTFFICLQIKLGLSPNSNTNFVSSVYYVWSLLHLLARVYLVSLSASRINDYAHEVRKLYQACPTHAYTLEVQRADNYLSSCRIGLTGLGCFVITKPFILTVVGVVFTLEIVLLQTIQ